MTEKRATRAQFFKDLASRPDLDCDYFSGREFTGEFKPMPSREESNRFQRPIPGGPQLMVNQWDKRLAPER